MKKMKKNSIFNLDYQQKDIDAKIIAGIERISEIMRILIWRESLKNSLNPTQIRILLSLLFGKNINLKKIEDFTSLDKTTLSKSIKSLEKRGFIRKIRSINDKRQIIIVIDKNKKDIIKEISFWANDLKNILSYFSLKEKSIILKFIFEFIDYSIKKGIISYQNMCSQCIYFMKKREKFYCNFLKKSLKLIELRIECSDFKK